MPIIEPPDSHFVSAAEGWFELGNLAEARGELDQISSPVRNHPRVLELHWLMSAQSADWPAALAAARASLELAPDNPTGWLHHAYALRRVPDGGLSAAWAALWPALEKFPDNPIIPYNLACYACQLERLGEARELLQRALKTGRRETVKRMALADSDLRPLWDEIRNY